MEGDSYLTQGVVSVIMQTAHLQLVLCIEWKARNGTSRLRANPEENSQHKLQLSHCTDAKPVKHALCLDLQQQSLIKWVSSKYICYSLLGQVSLWYTPLYASVIDSHSTVWASSKACSSITKSTMFKPEEWDEQNRLTPLLFVQVSSTLRACQHDTHSCLWSSWIKTCTSVTQYGCILARGGV